MRNSLSRKVSLPLLQLFRKADEIIEVPNRKDRLRVVINGFPKTQVSIRFDLLYSWRAQSKRSGVVRGGDLPK
jgi:hypothetical protein